MPDTYLGHPIMKVKIIIIITICAFVCSCAEEKPTYYTETEETTETVTCPLCNGSGCHMCNYSSSVYVPVEVEKSYEKKGSNVSFRGSKKSYYAECVHCACKLYVPISGGDSYCANCANHGHLNSLRTSHVLRH